MPRVLADVSARADHSADQSRAAKDHVTGECL
jgi:hypothetical protein